ncbi:MAG TPA: hypothetical protein VEP49_02040 [Acidimicrobiia bacterium]|nr:hypothetical protein [Acidimicrobiia bacterium]
MRADERQREGMLSLVRPQLGHNERVVALLPFANATRRPKGTDGKVRDGLWQTARRYRPLLLTDRRLFVFDTRRTPHPQRVLASFAANDVRVAGVSSGTFGRTLLVLELPGDGEVPFELGKRDQGELRSFVRALGYEVAP